MDIPDILKGLVLDRWYKVFVAVGAILFTISLFVDVKGITNPQIQLISSGLFFIGIGEWKNWKYQYLQKPPNVYTGPAALLEVRVRQPDFLGIVFDLLGAILLIAGITGVIYSSFASVPALTPTVSLTPTPIP